MEKGKGSCWFIWLSGVGTTRGAASAPPRLGDLAVGDRGILSIRVSVLRADCDGGGGACAASAAGSTVSTSPSKKRVMAIWAFHWHFWSSGTAVSSSWSVTEVNCWSASCWSSLRLVMSTAGSDISSTRSYRALAPNACYGAEAWCVCWPGRSLAPTLYLSSQGQQHHIGVRSLVDACGVPWCTLGTLASLFAFKSITPALAPGSFR